MNKIEDAVASFRKQPEAVMLRAILERNMGITSNTYAEESVGRLLPEYVAALSVIRAIFEGGTIEKE